MKRNCPYPSRKKIVEGLRNDILEHIEENPDCTKAEIRERFGSPESFAYTYIQTMDDAERYGIIRRARWISRCIALTAAICILLWMLAMLWMIKENSKSVPHHYVEYIETIQYDNTNIKEPNQ